MPYQLHSDQLVFPHPLLADPNGILAFGGDLSVERLKLAYAFGIFPWYGEHDPIVWWFPDPRCVMKPADIVISGSMRTKLKRQLFRVTFDTAFAEVITQCRQIPRKGQTGTWIHPEMQEAYMALHHAGYAHSVEVWQDDILVGGLYGLNMGRVFFGESMFSQVTDSSKYGLIVLAKCLEREGHWLIDCQENTPHLRSMGAQLMSARRFHAILARNRSLILPQAKWKFSTTELI